MEIYTEENEMIGYAILMDFSEDYLYITKPVRKGIVRSLRVEAIIRVVYYAETKLIGFNTQVKDEILDNITLYQIPIPDKYDTVQRRRFVRVPWTVDIRYVKLEEDERVPIDDLFIEDIEKYYEGRIKSGLTFDLSGEGIGMVSRDDFIVDQRLIVMIEHPKINLITLGIIRRAEHIYEQRNYRLGVEFIGISNRQKENIIQFVFEKMRKQIKVRVKSRGE